MNKFIAKTVWIAVLLSATTLCHGQNNVLGAPVAIRQMAPILWSTVSGTVLDPSGLPAAGVEITIFPGPGTNAVTTTDTNGRFECELYIEGYPNGGSPFQFLLARDPARNFAFITQFRIPVGGQLETNFQLRPGIKYSLTIESEKGKPVASAVASVSAWVGNVGAPIYPSLHADANGRMELPAMPQGQRVSFKIEAKGYGTADLFSASSNSFRTLYAFPTVVLPASKGKSIVIMEAHR